jgi:hypothetical protein
VAAKDPAQAFPVAIIHHHMKTAGDMSKPTGASKPKDSQVFGLVDRCFVFFDRDGHVGRQGVVRAKVTETVYLIQYFDWIMGEPSTLELVSLDRMVGDGKNLRSAGSYEFFENDEHLRFWMEHRYHNPDAHSGNDGDE